MGITFAIFQQLEYCPNESDKFISKLRDLKIPPAQDLSALLLILSKPHALEMSKLYKIFNT
jgi:hypothetical protein